MSNSRRDFLKQLASTTALTAAFTPTSGSFLMGESSADLHSDQSNGATGNSSPEPGKKIGYCIVGLGRISMDQFMPGVRISQHSKIVAFVSGHRPKAERVADQYGVSHNAIYNYENYDTIRNNPEIDAVYIALPNGMHAEYTIRAAKAGKHVLCEKPMANTVEECEQMIAACKQANRKLMIAYRCRYEPTNLKAIELVRQGYAGKVLAINSSNGFNIRAGEWRLNKKLAGGGPLFDVGIYSIQASRYLTGEDPAEVQAYSSVIDHDGRFTEVEENVVWNFRFPSGILASCATTYGSNFIGAYARVVGTKGMLELNPAFGYEGLRLTGKADSAQPVDIDYHIRAPKQFAVEADYFARCITENKQPKTDGEEGLRDQRLMAAIYQSCAEERSVKLAS